MLPCVQELTLVFAGPWEWKMQAKSMLISLEIGHASKVSDKVTFSTVREVYIPRVGCGYLTNRLDHAPRLDRMFWPSCNSLVLNSGCAPG